MNKLKHYIALPAALSIAFFIALAGSAFGQKSDDTKNAEATKTTKANEANIQTVDARQNGEWTVGINPAKNTVQLSATEPLPVKVMEKGRKPFQKRIIVTPIGNGFETVFMPIPAGKRLVIENVSAIVRCPEGMRMEVNYFTHMDNGDGQGGISAITFHRFALTDQGSFDGTGSIFTANHKVLVFADEQIGTNHYQVGVQARLNLMPPANAFVQAQITFSGYLEDLPIAQ